jgi:predicted AAA+ superfamily ATPase
MAETLVERRIYLDKLKDWREKRLIKVISGVRRCGKSTLLSLYIAELKKSGVPDQDIIFLNLEDVENEDLLHYKALYAYLVKRLHKGRYTYIFVDEVQECSQFEKAVDSLFLKENVDIYITGSNSYMLSGELATKLSGRYVEISLLPLSFAEYLTFTGTARVKEAFTDYLRFGAFPYVASLGRNTGLVKTYIDGIYNTILIKDIARREGIGDITLLENIVRFLCSAVGSPVSAKRICDTINSSGRKVSVNTIESYIRSLVKSYIFYPVHRFDIRGKQYLKTLGKYYIVDIGIRNILLSSASPDTGHLLENILYLELIRRGYTVYTGKLDEREVDFVASGLDGIAYYQVAASVLDERTLGRELEVLRRIKDNHPKYLLSLDDGLPPANHGGIRQMNLIDWILDTGPRAPHTNNTPPLNSAPLPESLL